ncbi:predicted protein [Naegleria gruberi]|uniref:Predicted protein n=1 Tax=Naegleria gruberi TaxID=5762 RepID=D2VXU8_NAEGR|nr:uncharacterized protein NAEGRDRAFT_53112 [Naegleria gruberi]EFC38354.1 predicted protein [Naegleria gruberi]|eukprot:XP_002671098.1 predicted protein [Naegleria gruberi strain NEG-M]
MMTLIYMILNIPASITGSFLTKKFGLRFGMILVAWLNFIGGCIRCLGYKKGNETFFWIAFGGQIFCALAQPLALNSATLLAFNWFGEKERTVVSVVSVLMAIFGGGASFAIGPSLLTAGSTDMSGSEFGMLTFLGAQVLIATMNLLLVVVFFKANPPTPPILLKSSKSEETIASINSEPAMEDESSRKNDETLSLIDIGTKQTFFEGVKSIITDIHFINLALAFTFVNSVFSSFASILNQVIQSKGYTPFDGSKFNIIMMVCSVIGSIVMGILFDKTKRYKLIAMMSSLLATFGFACFATVMIWNRSDFLFGMGLFSHLFIGLFAIPTLPLIAQMIADVTFPVLPSTSAALAGGFGTVCAGIYLIIINFIQEYVSNETSSIVILWMDVGMMLMCFIMLSLFRGKFKRTLSEKS